MLKSANLVCLFAIWFAEFGAPQCRGRRQVLADMDATRMRKRVSHGHGAPPKIYSYPYKTEIYLRKDSILRAMLLK